MKEVRNYLRDPLDYFQRGIRLRKAILLYGPSGTGKTALINALINESNVNYFYISATDLIGNHMGQGPYKIRSKSSKTIYLISELFKKARENQPSIIYISNLQCLSLNKPMNYSNAEATKSYEINATITQLLFQMGIFI